MPDAAELARLYAQPHEHDRWADHVVRVDVTIAVARLLTPPGALVVDLSCGDGTIARTLASEVGGRTLLGDYAPGPHDLTGPIEETLHALRWKQASMLVLSETIEHLDDPDAVLRLVREKCDHLVLSTPDGETDDRNPEHIWGWDSDEVRSMLLTAGFEPMIHTVLDLRPAGFEYAFQIHVCR